MNKWIWFLLGILIGVSMASAIAAGYGAKIAMEQCIYAADVIFDIKLSDKALNIARQYPQLLRHFNSEELGKMGFNATEIKEENLKRINETLNILNKIKYPSYEINNNTDN